MAAVESSAAVPTPTPASPATTSGALIPNGMWSSPSVIAEGSLVILYENHASLTYCYAKRGDVFYNRHGDFRHDDMIGKPFGSKIVSHDKHGRGGYMLLLAPTPELWSRALRHRTQIVYSLDASAIQFSAALRSGHRVVESGTGSGALTTSFARTVAPHGHVFTFEFNPHRAEVAREEFKRNGLSDVITVDCRDAYGDGFPEELAGTIDLVFLDLPCPWKAIHHATKMLKQGGHFASYFQWLDHNADLRRASVASFNAFLRGSKTQLHELLLSPAGRQTTVVHVMIGNEAADADSIVSSLVYAFHRDALAAKTTTTAASSTLFLPVLPIPRDELALRCDVLSLFQSLEIDTSSILFVDEFPWRDEALKSRLHLTLLDHNALNTKRIAAEVPADELGKIVEILDHHKDVGSHQHAPHREIAFENGQALVASCCTIVAEKLLETPHRDPHVHALGSTMLLAVIALDSVNFDPSAKKVTPRDIAAADKLEDAAFATRGKLFKWLQSEKFNVAHWAKFSIGNCLQCDYKEFQVPASSQLYGVSAILIPLRQFVQKASSTEAFIAALESYSVANNLAFLVVMSMSFSADGDRHREVLIYEAGNNQAFTKQCVAHFLDEGSLQLQRLTDQKAYEDPRIVAFDQRNTGASRKQVVPLIQDALSAPAAQL